MKIHYSPFINGKAYIDYASRPNGGLLGECAENSIGLLHRLELIAGLSYPDEVDEEMRAEVYFDVLSKAIKEDDAIYNSFCIDLNEKNDNLKYRVTREILQWRDQLILAGWDMKTSLPGKLSVISEAEKLIDSNNVIKSGEADRWTDLYTHIDTLLAADIDIEVHCPKILVPTAISKVLDRFGVSYPEVKQLELIKEKCKVLKFKELTDAYEWLALQDVKEGQIIACKDDIRLDSTFRSLNRPTSVEKTMTGSHHVVNDIRCMLDSPKSLIWLDCNGDYGFTYPYFFLGKSEQDALSFIPSKEDMLLAINFSIVDTLNRIENVTLVKSLFDNGTALTEHPMVSTVLYSGKENSTDDLPFETNEFKMTEPRKEYIFSQNQKTEYDLDGVAANVGGSRISQSSLETMIENPFDYVVEKEANMYETIASNINIEKGKLAHSIIENMIKDHGKVSPDAFDEVLKTAVELAKESHDAKELLNPANRFVYEDFIKTIRSSTYTLSSIIEEQNLIPVGCEIKIEGELEPFGNSIAYIDMLLKKSEKEYVIFDFKYSSSDFHYKKFETNESIQLEFYREIFDKLGSKGCEGHKDIPSDARIVAVGYYQFPLETLYVPEGRLGSDVLHGNHITAIELDTENACADLLEYMHKEYNDRIEEFSRGIIKTGDTDSPFKNHIVLKNQLR